jgi:hypothetical protein
MIQHLRRTQLGRGEWLVMATFVSALFSVACGRVALLARSPASRATPRIIQATGDGMTEEGSRDARTRSAELMTLTAFSERVVRSGDLQT